MDFEFFVDLEELGEGLFAWCLGHEGANDHGCGSDEPHDGSRGNTSKDMKFTAEAGHREEGDPTDENGDDAGVGSGFGGALPIQGSDDKRSQSRESGETPDSKGEDELLFLSEENEGNEVNDDDDTDDKASRHEESLLIGVGFFGVVEDDVVGEHGAEAEELGVERGHDSGEDAGGDESDDERVCYKFCDHDGENGTGVSAGGKLTSGPDTDEDTGDPDDGDTDGMGDDGELEAFGAFRGEPVLEEMGKHAHAKWDEHVGEEGELRDSGFAIDGSDFVAVFGLFHGCGNSAEFVGNEVEGEDAHDHEDDGLKGIGPSRRAGASGENVGEDDDADDKSTEPRRDGSVRGPFGKDAGIWSFCAGDSFDGFGSADDSDEEVGDDEKDEDREKEVAEGLGVKAGAEVLNLGNVAVAFSDGPEFDADEEEAGGVDEARRGGHEPISANAGAKGLAGRSDEGESGHGGAEDRHEEHEGANGVAGDEVILRGAPKEGF